MTKELREFRRLERVCLEQAALSTLDLARTGLLKVADDCRIAAEALESQPARGALASAVQRLRQALAVSRPGNWH